MESCHNLGNLLTDNFTYLGWVGEKKESYSVPDLNIV